MNKGLIILLFLAVVFVDGIVSPALFGFRESFLTIIFLVVILLYYKASLQGLILGILFSGLVEFYWGLKLGILILPLLASSGVFFLLSKFFNVRSMVSMIFSGVIMFVVFWGASVFISKIT